MKIYLVGGAVRDKLLGIPVKEKDWVVVGATAEEMVANQFRPVGKDFPVFLHPTTYEEYALARTERKISRGYTGFDFNASPQVTLEEDLLRRDLTINAMAETVEGQLIDPYQGKKDLEKKLLRHVSAAFVEDPVRILRVARFAARYAELGFTVAPETIALMKEMVLSGEVNALVPERVWKELVRGLGENSPEKFFQVLAECDALPILFPELALESVGMQALQHMAKTSADVTMRFSALLHDLSEQQVKLFCNRYRVPNEFRELALLVSCYIPDYRRVRQLNAREILYFLKAVDAFRREERFKKFIAVCEAIVRESFSDFLWRCFEAAKEVDIGKLLAEGHRGKAMAEEIDRVRVERIQKVF